MTKSICRFFGAVILTAFAVVAVAAGCPEDDKTALKKMDKAWGDAINAGDKAAVNAMLHDNYAAFDLSGTTGKKEALDGIDGPAPPTDNEVISDNYIISCSGDTAVLTHRNEFRIKDGDSVDVNYSRSVHVFQKAGGKWRVIASVNHPMNEGGALIYHNYSGMAAFKAKDMEWFEKAMDDNYFAVGPDGSIIGRDKVLEGIKNDSNKYDMMEMSDIGVNIVGDTAIVTGVYHSKGKSADGTPFDVKSRFTRTFAKKHGKWVALSTHTTMMDNGTSADAP